MVFSRKKKKLIRDALSAAAGSESEIQEAPSSDFKNPENPTNSSSQQSLEQVESISKKRKNRRSKRGGIEHRKRARAKQEKDGELKGIGSVDEMREKSEEGSGKVIEDKNKKREDKLEARKLKNSEKLNKLKKMKMERKKMVMKKIKKKEEALLSAAKAEVDDQVFKQTANNTDISEGNIDVSTKVYVGGIPYYSTEDDIRSYFESCGTITEIDCMKFPESGKFRGIAIMNFKTEAAAKRALALDGSDMGGFFLKIQPYKQTRLDKTAKFSPTIVEGYNRIYVGNLSWDITEEDLRKLFSDLSIASIRFGEDKETGEFRGYAHVDFSDTLSLNLALKLDQKIICGRPVRISCAVPSKAPNNKTKSMPVPETDKPVNDSATAVSGKIRRRLCHLCKERGHLSSSCPKNQAVDQTDPTTS